MGSVATVKTDRQKKSGFSAKPIALRDATLTVEESRDLEKILATRNRVTSRAVKRTKALLAKGQLR